MPVRSLRDQIDVQVGAGWSQRSCRFNEFPKAFLRVHTPNVNDALRGRVDAKFPPRLEAVSGVETEMLQR